MVNKADAKYSNSVMCNSQIITRKLILTNAAICQRQKPLKHPANILVQPYIWQYLSGHKRLYTRMPKNY